MQWNTEFDESTRISPHRAKKELFVDDKSRGNYFEIFNNSLKSLSTCSHLEIHIFLLLSFLANNRRRRCLVMINCRLNFWFSHSTRQRHETFSLFNRRHKKHRASHANEKVFGKFENVSRATRVCLYSQCVVSPQTQFHFQFILSLSLSLSICISMRATMPRRSIFKLISRLVDRVLHQCFVLNSDQHRCTYFFLNLKSDAEVNTRAAKATHAHTRNEEQKIHNNFHQFN